MLIAGAQRVLQGGREDHDKLLMDRYRRSNEEKAYSGGVASGQGSRHMSSHERPPPVEDYPKKHSGQGSQSSARNPY